MKSVTRKYLSFIGEALHKVTDFSAGVDTERLQSAINDPLTPLHPPLQAGPQSPPPPPLHLPSSQNDVDRFSRGTRVADVIESLVADAGRLLLFWGPCCWRGSPPVADLAQLLLARDTCCGRVALTPTPWVTRPRRGHLLPKWVGCCWRGSLYWCCHVSAVVDACHFLLKWNSLLTTPVTCCRHLSLVADTCHLLQTPVTCCRHLSLVADTCHLLLTWDTCSEGDTLFADMGHFLLACVGCCWRVSLVADVGHLFWRWRFCYWLGWLGVLVASIGPLLMTWDVLVAEGGRFGLKPW